MEIEQLRQVPLVDLLTRLGFAPAYRRGQDVWYRSPLREERTASFKVNTDRNVWFDFGLGKGGDIFHLAGELTGSTDFSRQVDFSRVNRNTCRWLLGQGLPGSHRHPVSNR